MTLIDTHCHLEYNDKIERIVNAALNAGVKQMIIPSVNASSALECKHLVASYDFMYWAAGIHPEEVLDFKSDWGYIEGQFEPIEADLRTAKKLGIVAVGECGLDFAHLDAGTSVDLSLRKSQIRLFKQHIDWALKYKLPLIIHNRKANQELLTDITKHPELTGVFHCFCQKKSFAKQILEQTNFYFGLGGLITTDQGLAETVKTIPLDRIVLETDSPYLIPKEAKTESVTNEPAFMVYTARKLAEIKGITIEEVAEVTTRNANILFRLNLPAIPPSA